jgi:hypothetical protein
VTVYTSGSALLGSISYGISEPVALAFGSAGYLWVADLNANRVTEYGKASSSAPLLRAIHGLSEPVALAFGP